MTRTITFATIGLIAAFTAGSALAQTAPAADPHAGHAMPAPTTDPHAGHNMSAMSHGSMSVPAPTGTALRTSTPAAGAMLNASPTVISLTLPHAMTMQSVILTNAAGQRIPLSATLSAAPVETLTSPVPTLPSGTYSVAWTAAGTDHTMTGTFGFMVH